MKHITLQEWSRRNGRNERSMRRKAQAGGFKTAQKLGNQWIISASEPYIDGRAVRWSKERSKDK